jgi:hypothetical protein
VLKPDQQASEAEILAYACERIGGYKLPKSIDFVDALPHTPPARFSGQFGGRRVGDVTPNALRGVISAAFGARIA